MLTTKGVWQWSLGAYSNNIIHTLHVVHAPSHVDISAAVGMAYLL